MLKKYLSITLLFCCLITLGCSNQTANTVPTTQTAVIINRQNETIGTAVFSEKEKGVEIKINVSQLPPGVHGMHLHENGTCTAPDFQSAGGHFNPHNKKHGKKNPAGSHAGDLDNLIVNNEGKGHTTQMIHDVTLKKGESNSLLKPGGTSLIIHEKEDDMRTDPSGDSGDRIACGVIK